MYLNKQRKTKRLFEKTSKTVTNWKYIYNFPEGSEVDQIYQVLKQAGEISNNKPRVNLEPVPPVGITVDRGAPPSVPGSSGSSGQTLNRKGGIPPQPQRAQGSSLTVNNPAPCSTSSGLLSHPSTSNFFIFLLLYSSRLQLWNRLIFAFTIRGWTWRI